MLARLCGNRKEVNVLLNYLGMSKSLLISLLGAAINS